MNIEVFSGQKIAPYAAAIGGVLVLIGFFMRGNSKKSSVIGVTSMFLISIGAILLIYAISQWVSTNFSGWQDYSGNFQR